MFIYLTVQDRHIFKILFTHIQTLTCNFHDPELQYSWLRPSKIMMMNKILKGTQALESKEGKMCMW